MCGVLFSMLWYQIILAVLLTSSSSEDVDSVSDEWIPYFGEPIGNITVALGKEAVLACTVRNLGLFKVAWLKAEDHTVLSLNRFVVTHNSRISVSHEPEKDTWRLHIRPLKHSDTGCYMCQINTTQMKKQIGCLDVHVPPDILDGGTSSDMRVDEGDNVTLSCRAKGRPQPRIVWRREDARMIMFHTGKGFSTVESYNGQTLRLLKIEYTQMGAYLCIATNDIPPAVSKRIVLQVNFAPIVKSTSHLVGAGLGSTVKLQCDFHAFPNENISWHREIGEIHDYGGDYTVESSKAWYEVTMHLTIRNIRAMDFGRYYCIVFNNKGMARGTIQVYETRSETTSTTTERTNIQEITTPKEDEETRPTPGFVEIGTTWMEPGMDGSNEVDEGGGGVEASSRRRSFSVSGGGGRLGVGRWPLLAAALLPWVR